MIEPSSDDEGVDFDVEPCLLEPLEDDFKDMMLLDFFEDEELDSDEPLAKRYEQLFKSD